VGRREFESLREGKHVIQKNREKFDSYSKIEWPNLEVDVRGRVLLFGNRKFNDKVVLCLLDRHSHFAGNAFFDTQRSVKIKIGFKTDFL
jgi:hypothetical protein